VSISPGALAPLGPVTSFGTFTFSLSGLADPIRTVRARRGALAGGGHGVWGLAAEGTSPPPSSQTLGVAYPPGFGEGARAEIVVGDGSSRFQRLRVDVPMAEATLSIDVSNMLLPWIRIADPEQLVETTAWAYDGGGAADGAIFQVVYEKPNSAGELVEWVSIAPAGTTHVRFPRLPADLAALTPAVGQLRSSADGYLVESPAVTSYAQFRATAGERMRHGGDLPSDTAPERVSGVSGR